MTSLVWDQVGNRTFQTGVDRGVLYLPDGTVVPWNGLTSVEETPGREVKESYLDGIKYLNYQVLDGFSGKLSAFTYPDEFDSVNGIRAAAPGMFVHDQMPTPFHLSYRTKVGNDVDGVDHGYRIHIIWNLLANPDSVAFSSQNASVEPIEFGWTLSAVPSLIEGYRPTAHLSFLSTEMSPEAWDALEEILYGSDESAPELPSPGEIFDVIAANTFSIYEWAGGPQSIPDDAPGEYLYIPFVLPAVLSLVEVNFHITHPYASDLAGTIIPPDGNDHQVFYRVGGSGDNFGTGDLIAQRTRLRDDAAARICDVSAADALLPGTFRPCLFRGGGSDEPYSEPPGYQDSPLSQFGPQDAGTWYLRIRDYAGGDEGVVHCASLVVTLGEAGTLELVDNGDGSWTASGPMVTVGPTFSLSEDEFEIEDPAVTLTDPDTFQIETP